MRDNKEQDSEEEKEFTRTGTGRLFWPTFFITLTLVTSIAYTLLSLYPYLNETKDKGFSFPYAEMIPSITLLTYTTFTGLSLLTKSCHMIIRSKLNAIIAGITGTLTYVANLTDKEISVICIVIGVCWLTYLKETAQTITTRLASKKVLTRELSLFMLITCGAAIAYNIAPKSELTRTDDLNKRKMLFIANTTINEEEYTDSIIAFKNPAQFICVKDTAGATTFSLDNGQGTSILIFGDYFDTMFGEKDFKKYCEMFENEDNKELTNQDVVIEKMFTIHGNKTFLQTKKYTVSNIDLYWTFAVIQDAKTNKLCVFSSYDMGNSSYVGEILESVKF